MKDFDLVEKLSKNLMLTETTAKCGQTECSD